MWLDEIRFSQFQSGGCKWVRREADEVMKPSGPVPTVQAYGGSVMIWGWFSWSAMLCAQKIRSSTWIYWMTRSSISGLSWSHWKHHWLPMLWYKPWRVYVILVVAFYLWIFFFLIADGMSIFEDDNAMIHQARIIECVTFLGARQRTNLIRMKNTELLWERLPN